MSPATSPHDPAAKFDAGRADDYAVQSRTALAGYDACHEVAACLLAAALGRGTRKRILVAGVGGSGQEIVTGARLEPGWRYTGVDPSAPMLDKARAAIDAAGLADRAELHLGRVEDQPAGADYDAAMLVGVLHHVPETAAKRALLAAIAARVRPGAPFILAGNRTPYASRPLFLKAWAERWRMFGERDDAVEARLGTILAGAVPPASDAEVAELLDGAGFDAPELFFSSLFWGGWIAFRRGDAASSTSNRG